MERPVLKQTSKLRALRIAAILLWCAVLIWAILNRSRFTLDAILSYTPESPLLAAVIMMGFFALKSLTVVFYSGLLYLANGSLFPLPAAILLNVLGTMVMVLIPYCTAHSFGSEYAASLLKKHPKLKTMEALRRGNDLAFAVLLRSVNIVNFDIGSMYMGAVGLRLPLVLLGSALGKAADIVLFPIIGENLGNPRSSAFWVALSLDLLLSVITVWIAVQMKKRNTIS